VRAPPRPPREDYVRATLEFDGFTYEPAVEYRGDDFDNVVLQLRALAKIVGYVHEGTDPMLRAQAIGDLLARRWPDRAYFVEVWQNGTEGFAQVFQPWGCPRNA
jgi:hypothetical protein